MRGLPARRDASRGVRAEPQARVPASSREFPRVPLHDSALAHFEQWAGWGRELMDLHVGYEAVEPWPVKRHDEPDTKARGAGERRDVAHRRRTEERTSLTQGRRWAALRA